MSTPRPPTRSSSASGTMFGRRPIARRSTHGARRCRLARRLRIRDHNRIVLRRSAIRISSAEPSSILRRELDGSRQQRGVAPWRADASHRPIAGDGDGVNCARVTMREAPRWCRWGRPGLRVDQFAGLSIGGSYLRSGFAVGADCARTLEDLIRAALRVIRHVHQYLRIHAQLFAVSSKALPVRRGGELVSDRDDGHVRSTICVAAPKDLLSGTACQWMTRITSTSFNQFNPVSERVVHIGVLVGFTQVAVRHMLPGVPEDFEKRLQIAHEKTRVRLLCRPELRVDSEMDSGAGAFEPRSAASDQM